MLDGVSNCDEPAAIKTAERWVCQKWKTYGAVIWYHESTPGVL